MTASRNSRRSLRPLAFGFEPGTAYSGSDSAGVVGTLDLDTGVLTPVATGFGSVRGMVFVSPVR